MNTLSISLSQKSSHYNIDFFTDFSLLYVKLNEQINNRSYLFVTDENVFEKTVFFEHIPKEKVLVLPAGEHNKNWESITKILDECFRSQLDRSSVLIAVGGGVIGDMTGFAASIFMRGIPVIQVPTTLLSMVDSSVGGKTGVDIPQGKNLIGSFHQPEKVLCCKDFLETLEFVEIQNGLAEMIKHAIIASTDHFTHLEKFAQKYYEYFLSQKNAKEIQDSIFPLVEESVCIKKSIVEQDEKEHGVRGFLNLGHTYGHAIELLSHFNIPHGIAVAMGIWQSILESEKRNMLLDIKEKEKIKNIFNLLSISLLSPFDLTEIHDSMIHDKKKKDGRIRLILIKEIGSVKYVNL